MPSPDENKILIIEEKEVKFDIFEFENYKVGYFMAKNKDKSANNEDSLFIYTKKDQIICGVSDGAGGHPKGKEAAAIVGEEIIKTYSKQDVKEINNLNTIGRINFKILELKAGARCTLAMLQIYKNKVKAFSVGDSEIVYWNSHGKMIYSNIPSSSIGYQVEAGVIQQEDSLDSPDRNYVDNMLGDQFIRIEATNSMGLKKGHTLLVGSDGLFDNLSHDQLSKIAAGNFDKSFAELVEICHVQDEKSWKKDDDISFIFLRKIKA